MQIDFTGYINLTLLIRVLLAVFNRFECYGLNVYPIQGTDSMYTLKTLKQCAQGEDVGITRRLFGRTREESA